MKDYKRVVIDCLWMSAVLTIWFLYIHRNTPMDINSASGLLNWISIGVGYNFITLHCTFYIGMCLMLLMHLLPSMNEQILTRMNRSDIMRDQFVALLQAVVIFVVVFQIVFLLMLMYFCGAEVLEEYGFYLVYGLYTLRLIVVYTLFGMLFLLLKVVLWRKEWAFIGTITTVVLWNKFGQRTKYVSIFYDLGVYNQYFSNNGLDIIEYISVMIKYITAILIAAYVIFAIFERRDILHDKK